MKILKGFVTGIVCLTLLSSPVVGVPHISESHHVEASVKATAMYPNKNIEVYSNRSSKSKRVTTVPYGARIERLAVHSSWSQLRYKGKIGWVASRNLIEIKKTEVLDTKKAVTIYTSRSTKAKVVTNIPAAASVTRLAVNKSWTQVRYNGKIGWVASSQLKIRYTKETFAPRTYRVKEDATLKARYVSSGEELVSIPKGTIITSSERYNTWYKVSFEGKTGWVMGKHITSYKETAKDIALKVFGSKYTISGSGYSLSISDADTYLYMDKDVYVIEKGNREVYDKSAQLITQLHGGNWTELNEYMWNARPGEKHWNGVYFEKYYVVADPSGGVLISW